MLKCKGILAVALMMLGSIAAHAEIAVEYGMTGGYQNISKESGRITAPVAGSVDLALDMNVGAGHFHMLMEGSNGLGGRAASVVLGSNYDVGTAVDGTGSARLQLSEFSYGIDFFAYDFSIGLQKLFNFVDANTTSNSETDQFLSSSLVNNPTIAMPDYTPSAVFNYGYGNRSNATFIVANAYGIRENASVGYSNTYKDLFDFGKAADGTKKGVFALGEVRMKDQDVWLTIGSWVNTREVDSLKGSYVNLDYAIDDGYQWSTRYGWNDTKTSISKFASFSTSFAIGDDRYGVGVAWHSIIQTAAKPIVLESYYRWQLSDNISLTPDVQFWWDTNGLSASTASAVGGNVVVYGIRFQYAEARTY